MFKPDASGTYKAVFQDESGRTLEIRDVWAETLEQEMAVIRELIEKNCYVAMDTEFPGVVARPIGSFPTQTEYQYQTLRCNVDLLKIIQLGLSFADEHGNFAEGCPTWQFNFKFSLSEDMYAQDSIDLLTRSGIDFGRHEEHGIDVARFGEILMSSGLALDDNIKWISFHSGYDFGYLLKLLTCAPLPAEESQFFELLHTYFPCIYDIKYLMLSCENLKGGLAKLAEDLESEEELCLLVFLISSPYNLNVKRIGPEHQAGSDSLLTAATFFKLKKKYFNGMIDDDKYVGHLYGLGNNGVSGTSSKDQV